jgi:hypothetical protein
MGRYDHLQTTYLAIYEDMVGIIRIGLSFYHLTCAKDMRVRRKINGELQQRAEEVEEKIGGDSEQKRKCSCLRDQISAHGSADGHPTSSKNSSP